MLYRTRRPWLLSVLGALLVLSSALPASTGTLAQTSARPRSKRLSTADWVPLAGTFRVGRTWSHKGGHSYPAIDFSIPAGQSVPVYAAGPGTVLTTEDHCADTTVGGANADCNGGQGNLVEIVHPDGRRTRYLHLRSGSLEVTPGQYICRGCRIGRSGWSGNVSPPGPEGAHLHYEEIEGFGQVNPGPMLAKTRAGKVRYPQQGMSWQNVGKRGLTLRNLGFPRPRPGPKGSCFSHAPTIVGTPKADEITGTAGPDIILGGDGNDTIQGLQGDDRLCGGSGDDRLDGDSEFDSMDGGDGTDTCLPDDGNESGQGTLVSCERPPFTLLVSVGCCLRVVTSDPGGISCPPDCSEGYGPQTQVRLTLSSGAAYWQGCDTENGTDYGSSCVVVMDTDRSVTV